MTEQRRAVLTDIGQIAMEVTDIPRPAAGEVLIRVLAVGICGSDIHYYEHGRIADFVVTSPLVLGHESSGVIVDVGSDVSRSRIGERVALEPQTTCGQCAACLGGRYNLCPDVVFFATPPVDGAFSEYVTLVAHRAHPVPERVSDEAAALIEPLAVAVWAAQKAGVQPGDHVLVTGAGPVGLLCADVARARGAASVTVSDVNPARLQIAKSRGADAVCDASTTPLSSLSPMDVVIEASGAASAVRDLFSTVAPAARIVLVGLGRADLELPVALIQTRELIVTGTFRYANAYPAAIELAASGRVDLDSLVTSRFPLDEVMAALEASRGDEAALKAVVLPGL